MFQWITGLLLHVGDEQSKPSTVGLNAFDLGEPQAFIRLCSLQELTDILQPGREREGRVEVLCSVMLNLQCQEYTYIYPLLYPSQQYRTGRHSGHWYGNKLWDGWVQQHEYC